MSVINPPPSGLEPGDPKEALFKQIMQQYQAKVKTTIDGVIKERNAMRDRNIELEKQVKELQAKVSEFNEERASMSESFDLLNSSKQNSEALLSQLNVLRAANILQEETVGTVTEQLEEKTQQVNQLKNTIETLQQMVAQHEKHIESQQKQLEVQQRLIDGYNRNIINENSSGSRRPISMMIPSQKNSFIGQNQSTGNSTGSSPTSADAKKNPFKEKESSDPPPLVRNPSKTMLNSPPQVSAGLAAAAAKMAQDSAIKRRESIVNMKVSGEESPQNSQSSLKNSGELLSNNSPSNAESPSSSPVNSPSMLRNRADSKTSIAEPELTDIYFTTTPEGVKEVRGGTIYRLVERLTWHAGIVDMDYLKAFFLTYRSFSNSDQILDLILQRYDHNPEGVSPEKLEATKQIVRARVVNVLRAWLTQFYNDFEENPALKHRMEKFVEDMSQIQPELVNSLKRCLTGSEREVIFVPNHKPPTTIIPKGNHIFDFDAAEFARQMTLADYELLIKIKQIELLGKPRTNLDLMIRRFNTVSNWVATMIVNENNLKERVKLMRHFIKIAKENRMIGNFNGTMQIVSGLQSSAVHRLAKTWEKLSKTSSQEDFDALLTLTSTNDNYSLYRQALKTSDLPNIPFLGVCLTDLTFIEDGMKNEIEGKKGMINFVKRRKMSIVVEIIRRSQSVPFSFHREQTIQSYLSSVEPLNASLLWQQSLVCEPRAPQK